MGRSSSVWACAVNLPDPGAGAQTHCHNCRASPQPSHFVLTGVQACRQIFNCRYLASRAPDLHIDLHIDVLRQRQRCGHSVLAASWCQLR